MTEIEKISFDKYDEFVREFYQQKKYPHQRLGQAFLNKFYPKISDSDLFYETNSSVASEIIFDRYINWEVEE